MMNVIGSKFVLVDTDALHDLYSNVGFPEHSRVSKSQFREHIDEWWERALKLNKVTSLNRRFTYSICTDVMSVSVNLKRKVLRKYYALAGFVKARKKRESWLTNAPDGLLKIMRGI